MGYTCAGREQGSYTVAICARGQAGGLLVSHIRTGTGQAREGSVSHTDLPSGVTPPCS